MRRVGSSELLGSPLVIPSCGRGSRCTTVYAKLPKDAQLPLSELLPEPSRSAGFTLPAYCDLEVTGEAPMLPQPEREYQQETTSSPRCSLR